MVGRIGNKRSFADVVDGSYGRKRAIAPYYSVDDENVEKIIDIGLTVMNYNSTAIDYLWNYKKGDQPINYRDASKTARSDVNNKVCENHAYEFVRFMVGQTCGEPIQFVSRRDNENVNIYVDKLNEYMADAFKEARDIAQMEWKSAVGVGYKGIQSTGDDDIPFRIIIPSPMNTIIVYSQYTDEPLLSVQKLQDVDGNEYVLAFAKNVEYTRKDDVITSKLHGYGDIPIVECRNNEDAISDIELVIPILDAVNNMQSERMNGIQQFVQSWIKFINCDIDEETFKKMRQNGALVVKSNGTEKNVDVDLMTSELDQSQTQVAKEDLLNNALSILAIPNKQGGTGGDSQGAVELRNGWDFAKSSAKLKDTYIKESEKRFAKLVLNVIRVTKGDCPLKITDFDVTINHSPQDNLVVKCQALQYLLECGIHPLVAIKTVGLWADAEKVFNLSKPYLENKYKTIDDIANEELKAKQLLDEYNNRINSVNKTVTE